MKLRHAVLLAGCGLMVMVGLAIFAATAATAIFDVVHAHYPGSGRAGGGSTQFSLTQAELHRRAEYRSDDDLAAVRRWYAALMDLEPSTTGNLLTSGNCAWLTTSEQIVLLRHTVTVVLCSTPPGTRIFVSEEVALAP